MTTWLKLQKLIDSYPIISETYMHHLTMIWNRKLRSVQGQAGARFIIVARRPIENV